MQMEACHNSQSKKAHHQKPYRSTAVSEENSAKRQKEKPPPTRFFKRNICHVTHKSAHKLRKPFGEISFSTPLFDNHQRPSSTPRRRQPEKTKKAKMGRLHSKGKGIASSAIPYSRTPPAWLKTTPDQVVDQICKLAKKGATPSQIGVVLRDSHGVAQVKFVTGMFMQCDS